MPTIIDKLRAIPPLLAAHVLAAAVGIEAPRMEAA